MTSKEFESKYLEQVVALRSDHELEIKDQEYYVTAALYGGEGEKLDNVFAVVGEDHDPENGTISWFTIHFDKLAEIEDNFFLTKV